MRLLTFGLLLWVTLLSGCSRTLTPEENQRLYKVGKPYSVGGEWYTPREDIYYDETGMASWYGPGFHGNKTANGESFDKYDLTAAHRTLPMPSIIRVTNLSNGKSVNLRVNDRGPFSRNRIVDVSKKAAQVLGFQAQGTAKVRVQFLPEETAALFGGKMPGRNYASLEKRELAPPLSIAELGNVNPPEMEEIYSAPPRGGNGQFIQVGTFRLRDNARRVVADLSRFGVANMEEIHQEEGRFYLVKLGPYSSEVEARRVLTQVLDSGYADAALSKI